MPATGEQVQAFINERPGDFIADVPHNHLYLGPRASKSTAKTSTKPASIRHALFRILQIGMSAPGEPFGHKSFSCGSGMTMSPDTLRRHVCELRHILRQLGVNAPVILKVPVSTSLSKTGYGYVFDSAWRYCVIDLSAEDHRR